MDSVYLTDLIEPDILQMLQDEFSNTMGVAALTTDQYGMPVTDGSNFTDFCMKYTRETELGNSRCMRCDKTGAEMTMNSKKPYCYYCHAGLMDFAAPIMEGYYKATKQPAIFTRYAVRKLCSNCNFSYEKAARELGYAPRPLKESLADTVAWIRETEKNGG